METPTPYFVNGLDTRQPLDELARLRVENAELRARLAAFEPVRAPVKRGACYGMTHVWLKRHEEIQPEDRCECGAVEWGMGEDE